MAGSPVDLHLKPSGRAIFVTKELASMKTNSTHVLHEYSLDEVLDEDSTVSKNEAHFADQTALRIGEKLVTVRAFVTLMSGTGVLKSVSYDQARGWILDVLAGLVERHSDNRIHGDVRPENVRVIGDKAELIDPGVRVRFEELDATARDYVAPELRGDARSRGTSAGDVYSFLRFARAILRPFRDAGGIGHISRLESQISWLFDASVAADPDERPKAAELQKAFESGLMAAETSVDPFLDGFNSACRALKTANSSIRVTNAVAKAVRADALASPETLLHLNEFTSRSLLTWRLLDKEMRIAHTRGYESPVRPHEDGLTSVSSSELPASIDDRWKNKIHRDFFGFGIGPDHDDRLTSPEALASYTPGLIQEYEQYVELSAILRDEILGRNDFIYTHDVAQRLSQVLGSEIRDVDVVVMRRWGWLLAVPDHDRWLYPVFQFDSASGLPSPIIRDVHDARVASVGSDADDWSTLAFWVQPLNRLGGNCPRDFLWVENGDAIIKSAIAPQS
ncbi:serine/threonine-protein kinase [Herbiconiux daphne]|uniref:Serine/threonine-protein kinase n=1 Tax=Herbiconiux daphne TaxID=2970914 RepID=A0ABT2H587_9MICO|nr:serine/threonine-protein kinase [Herbiconiux daphne]MCS5735091.1 serine/threonine-protein kinase [Herbiconiux daphne]